MTEQQYISFLKLCAEKHPQILHNDETNYRFSAYGEEIVTQIGAGGVLKITQPCLIIYCQEFENTTVDSGPQTRNSITVNFEICQYAEAKDFVAQKTAQTIAQVISMDIINEMKAYYFENLAPFNGGVKLSDTVRGNNTAGGKASLYGYRVELTITSPVSSGENHTLFTVQP
ncbi:hypothetical protein LV89_01985 [Arcicella aurantiaca]|uniref:Uncharacterized protein n=1 Tax=Arcicella aurantiaca TaxID=591202 RepID=A0A316E9J3_9BACT|nr:hypothetical protein [Arcicella aurantiaca]PWK27170.1 hypothetical protein LV89_01985 [Arcicella aurantiaca]